MEKLIGEILSKIGLGVATTMVADTLKKLVGKKVKRAEITRSLESIDELKGGRVEEVIKLLSEKQILMLQEDGMVEVAGTHEASGIGNITGLDIQGPAKIKPGTIARASGIGNITGTRIGGKK